MFVDFDVRGQQVKDFFSEGNFIVIVVYLDYGLVFWTEATV